MFWTVNEKTLREMSKYISACPQAGTHSRAKIKQSPGFEVLVLLFNDLEDVDEAGELRCWPGHEVREATSLIKFYRSPLTPAGINHKIVKEYRYMLFKEFFFTIYPEVFSKYWSLFSIRESGLSSLLMESKENSFFILSSAEAFLAFTSASSKGTIIFWR